MTSPPEIRAAEAEDAPAIAQIYVSSWNAGFGELMPPQQLTDRRIESWAVELVEPAMRWRVAVVGSEIAGFVGTGASRDPIDDGLGELDTIAVAPAFWRRGIGGSLMKVALDDLVGAGYTSAILWTLANYPQGQNFYQSTGWQLTGLTRDSGRQLCYRHDLGAAADDSSPPAGTDQDQQTPPAWPTAE